jgi:septal ring factor EnvC (AmiA/AmiB activator)
VIEGLGTVSSAGVRSRGIRFATPRGSPILAPAAGKILFAGAFREHDGIIVIDHGKGWTSLLIDVAPSVRANDRVAAQAPLGRALGDVALELREDGRPRSAALIAGSSQMLSNGALTR